MGKVLHIPILKGFTALVSEILPRVPITFTAYDFSWNFMGCFLFKFSPYL